MIRFLAATLAIAASLAGCGSDPDQRAASLRKLDRELPLLVRGPQELGPDAYFVFAYFIDPRPELHLALSRDGYSWKPVGGPVMVSKLGLRDPSIAQGPGGRFHMVFTGGGPDSIGYAHSADLITWTGERPLRVMPTSPAPEGCWAPELVWDDANKRWFIAWSAEVPGRFEATKGQSKVNHRVYYTTTTDFRTFAPPQLLLDPGYPSIDSTFVHGDGAWRMFFKDERDKPAKKQVRMATAPALEGPWGDITPALTVQRVEAPCAVKVGDHYLVYFDEYRWGRYGAIRTRDFKSWTDVSTLMKFPPGARHGSVFRVSPEIGRRLESLPAAGAKP